jgi:hypothetical protein
MKRTQDVRNLVPYELWKGDQAEPEDMDDGRSAKVIEVVFEDTRMKGSNVAFYAMSKNKRPESQINTFETIPDHIPKIKELDIWTSTESLDEEYHQEFVYAWNMEGSQQ